MQLTLRTLLAWRDRVLSEEAQQELDRKVLSNDLAEALEQQIEQLLTNRDLPAPPVAGKGLNGSASNVAEFLDNVLPGERLKEFETHCVESSVSLGEVAECHHVLAQMAGHAELSAELTLEECQRIGHLTRAHLAELADETRRVSDVANARAMRAELDAVAEQQPWVEAAPRPPVRRQPRLATLAAVLAVAVLLVLVGILGLQLFRENAVPPPAVQPPVAGNQPDAGLTADAADQAAADPAVVAVAATPDNSDAAEPAAAMPSAVEPGPTTEPGDVAAVAGGEGGTAPPASQPDTPEAPAAAGTPSTPAPAQTAAASDAPAAASLANRRQVPQGTAMAIGGPAIITPEAPLPEPDGTAPPGESTDPPLGFFESDGRIGRGVVLHRNRGNDRTELDGWSGLPSDSPLAASEEVMVPPGLNPVFDIGGVTVRMWPGTHARVKFDEAGQPRIQLLAGRLVARSANEASQLGLTAGGLSGVLLAGLTGGVAVEVTHVPEATLAARQGAQVRVARMLPLKQSVTWQQTQAGGLTAARLLHGIAETTTLAPQEGLSWSAAEPRAATTVQGEAVPDWMSSEAAFTATEKSACEALVAVVGGDRPLQQALLELADQPRIENRMIASETLALLSHYGSLVDLLGDLPPTGLGERKWDAFEARTIPLALADEGLAVILEKAFRDRLPAGRGEVAFRLASRKVAAESPTELTAQLIDLLEDDQPILRRYALQWLGEMYQVSDTERLRYRVDRPAKERQEGADWWRKQLEKGQLTPRVAAAAPTAGSD